MGLLCQTGPSQRLCFMFDLIVSPLTGPFINGFNGQSETSWVSAPILFSHKLAWAFISSKCPSLMYMLTGSEWPRGAHKEWLKAFWFQISEKDVFLFSSPPLLSSLFPATLLFLCWRKGIKGCNIDRFVFLENNFFSLKPGFFVHSFIYSFLHFFMLPFHPCQSTRAAASYKVVNCSVAHKGWWWIDCSTEHGDRESKEKDDRWWALIRDLGGESAHCNLETCMKNLPPHSTSHTHIHAHTTLLCSLSLSLKHTLGFSLSFFPVWEGFSLHSRKLVLPASLALVQLAVRLMESWQALWLEMTSSGCPAQWGLPPLWCNQLDITQSRSPLVVL